MAQFRELDYTELKSICTPENIGFKTTDELEPFDSGIIGQERAVAAFDFGLKVKMKGYNIYMSGPGGTGKTTYAKKSTLELAKNEETPFDWCYVYNFENPRSPQALRFKPGDGRSFKKDMEELVETFTTEIQKAFNTEDYEKKKNKIVKIHEDAKEALMKKLTDIAKEEGFGVKTTNSGVYFMPIIDGEAIDEEKYEDLDEEVKETINKSSDKVQEHAASIMRDMREQEKECKKKVEELDKSVCLFAIGHHFEVISDKYKEYERVIKYIDAVKDDVVNNIDQFVEDESEDDDALSSLMPLISKKAEDITLKYKVNLLVDNSKLKGAPVIVDFNPTYYNLVGEVEYDSEYGNLTTDFMKIKAGLIHKANGGYLIVQVQDILSNVQAWEALRRVIKTKEIAIEALREQFGAVVAPTLKPEPIPVDLKIIMIGSVYYYEFLHSYDDEFEKLFKIRADFDYEMKRTDNNIMKIAQFVRSFSDKEKTPPFDSSAICHLLDYSSRIVERQDKLTTCFNQLVEILCEAATLARLDNSSLITGETVEMAIKQKEQRLRLHEEKFKEMLSENVIMIDTSGKKIGQINGLAVYDMGSYAFGTPSRITATTYIGKSGIVNIEKEAEMSGQTHNKGVQIITGYLGQTYAQDFPLSLSCRICFEQNYSGIDGDSASSTELYCILSSLSELPINQELAVTGSVNQRGEIQAIGGVTYKIEGFFDLCKTRGLTGTQGVIIPNSNLIDLVLNDEVIQAVKDGVFHIYPISHIDEGIELLIGMPAGEKNSKGNYPAKSVHGRVLKKLKLFNEKACGE